MSPPLKGWRGSWTADPDATPATTDEGGDVVSDYMTWRKILIIEMEARGETFADVESSTLTDEQYDKEFDAGYGSIEGVPFTVWTKRHVYFPVCYDGSEWVGSVSRNPDGKPTRHLGGR
jgi:hypothetical protein